MANSFEQTNRYKKSWRLIDALDHLFRSALGWDPFADGFAIAHHLESWDDEKWASIALVAGCTPPGKDGQTKELILDRYRSRAKAWQDGVKRSA